jgi:hypothetical protein
MSTSNPTPRTQAAPPPENTWKRRLLFAVPVSAALAFTVFFFGPLDLFFNNYEELWFHLGDILGRVALTALLVFAVCALAGVLLKNEKLHRVYLSLLFGGLLGAYVQGSFMNKNYGTLNGTKVDWGAYTGYGVVNTLIWLVCLLLPLILMLVLREKRMRPVMIFLSCALILMQTASLVVSWINYPRVEASASLTRDGIYDLSKRENTVVFILDTLDEAYLNKFLEEKPEHRKTLSGFTCYNNTLASGARTQVALPLILTGLPRTEAGSYSEYIDQIWKEQTLFRDLDRAGWDTRLYTESNFVTGASQELVDNQVMSTSSVANHRGLNRKMYKLTLYKYVPHFLKPRFWMYTGDFDKFKKDTEYTLDDERFYRAYQKAGGFTYTDQEKVFRLYHMMGIHKPYILTSSGTRRKDREETSFRRQMNGIFKIVEDMLADMRENGVYDSANIFIIADHGDNDLCQWAACLYKPAGATGDLKISDAPVSMLDLTATLDALAGGDASQVGSGRTLEQAKAGEERTRSFYRNVGSNADFITGEYRTRAHASDAEAMKLAEEFEVTDVTEAPPYQLGTELSFAGDEATANVYCTHGFRAATNDTTHMEGRYGQLVIPIADPPKEGELEVTLGVHSVVTETPMEIKAGGKTVYTHDLDEEADFLSTAVFRVPASALKKGTLTLDFTFSGIPEEEEKLAVGERQRSIKVDALTIDRAD